MFSINEVRSRKPIRKDIAVSTRIDRRIICVRAPTLEYRGGNFLQEKKRGVLISSPCLR